MNAMHVSSLTLKQLRAIQQVYRTGQVSAAADALNITQSAVSVLIRQAETTLGTTLFDRTTRSLSPSAAGESVIGLVERILGDLSTLEETIRGLRDLERGQIRLTATPATGLTLLPDTVRRFRAAYPAVNLILDDCAPDQFYSNILEQRADFGIGTEPEDTSALEWHSLIADPLCIICATDHRFAERDGIPWRELQDEPLILSRRDYGVRGLVEQTLAMLGIRPRIVAEVGFLGSAAWMSACGIGLALLPGRLARAQPAPGIVTLPLLDPVVTRPAGVVKRRRHTLAPSAERFIEMLAEDLRDD
ncbi:LysR family transcriptional regulator [Anianabacter salinae]|uniref:LysR family transcriptional regulator n=1 Tax=Anianabacter salinae TaxID=2851023 RepID=UPI00225E0FAE|nr:LysR family transcriptional regulator [Anianabacter salinae]MBV0912452.1 LysR family transcriptional regulator [Anianabacter salinae]